MRKGMSIALAMLLAASTAAWAADIEGKIQRVDSGDRTIVLEDGTKLWLAEGLALDSLKEGTKFKASYEERDGKNIVTGFQVSD